MRKTIFITGGTGFIGSNLIRRLVEKEDVQIVTCGRSGIERSNIRDLNANVTFFQVDLDRETELAAILQRINPAIIIHLAADTLSDRKPEVIQPLMEHNFTTTLHLYHASLGLKNLECVVTFGSAGEYEQNTPPFCETQKEMPASPYSFSKACVSLLSSYFYRVHKLPIVVIRPFVVFGEYQTNNQFIPFVIKKCFTNESIELTTGDQAKDFIYVQDVVNAVIKLIELKNFQPIQGEIINIGSGQEISIRQAALVIKKITNSRSLLLLGAIQRRDEENMHFYGVQTKAELLLDWKPQYSFEEGIQNTIQWYKRYLDMEEQGCGHS